MGPVSKSTGDWRELSGVKIIYNDQEISLNMDTYHTNAKFHSELTLLRANIQHIITPNEGISILVLKLSIDIFFCLFQGYIHVAI